MRDTSLRDALKSPLFLALQQEGVLLEDHPGGCVLHEKRAEVERLLQARRYIVQLKGEHKQNTIY